MEIRAFASVLHGPELAGSQASEGVYAEQLHTNDRHRAMDFLMRCAQESKRVQCH